MKQFLKDAKGHLMTGIGYMLPLIIGASLVVAIPKLIALCFGITSLDPYADGTGIWHIMKLIENVGWTGIGMVNTVLAGFIAYSIADKPAIGAGLIGGAVASSTYAGFLGAVIAAFIAGYSVKWAKKHIKLPESMNSVMPLVVCPLIATGLVAVIMGVILATPLAAINTWLVKWISSMCQNQSSQLVMALILGAMIASDMGGPINKYSMDGRKRINGRRNLSSQTYLSMQQSVCLHLHMQSQQLSERIDSQKHLEKQENQTGQWDL